MKIKEIYNQGINIQKYFRDKNKVLENDINSILYSYDYQAGSYIKQYYDETIIEGLYILDGKKVNMTYRQFQELFGLYVAQELNALHPSNVLEVGTGEATSICDIILNMDKKIKFSGLELSLSRLLYASKFAYYKKVDVNFVLGDMFHMPYSDNAFDVVLMMHCLESNTGREKEALEELLRVTRKYIVLLEPSYELGNEETRNRIKDLCYINNLKNTIEELNLDVVKNELFKVTTYNNNTGITIIKKGEKYKNMGMDTGFVCPYCRTVLHRHEEAYFCPECFNLYPVIRNIPILNINHAILCSKYEK